MIGIESINTYYLTTYYLFTYDAFRSLNSILAVTFSLIRFRDVWSNIFRYLWHCVHDEENKKKFLCVSLFACRELELILRTLHL